MDLILFKRLPLIAIACSFGLTACSDNDDDITNNTPTVQPRTIAVSNYSATNSTAVSSISQKINYRMPSVNGSETSATAVVFVPKGTAPAGGWPIVAWAHGTTGVADVCAPSNTSNLGGVDPIIAQLVLQGYMVVAPDYEGLGSAGIHPYLNLASEGRSIVYAVLAARENVPSAGTRWLAYGHSQGGHAALGAAQYAKEATGLSYLGTVAIAPASNLGLAISGGTQLAGQLLQAGQVAPAIGILAQQVTFSAYVTAGLKQTTPISYSDVFDAQAAAIVPKVEEQCDVGNLIGANIGAHTQATGNPLTYQGLKANFASVPAISNFLSTLSEPATVKLDQPVLIIQGDADTTVPKPLTDKLVVSMSTLGSTVTYQTLSNKDHTTAFTDSLPEVLGFIGGRFNPSTAQ